MSLGRAGRDLGKGHGQKCGRGGGQGPGDHQLSRRRVGGAEPHPPARSFLLTATWHLMHFFILRAHSAERSAVGWGRTTRAPLPGAPPHPRTLCGEERPVGWGQTTRAPPLGAPHSPSHTVRCWHGENSTSSASSEHTRHSAASGPGAAPTCRFVTVLGVPSACLGPGAAPPPACRSLQGEEAA